MGKGLNESVLQRRQMIIQTHLKGCSTSNDIKKSKLETTMEYSMRTGNIGKTDNNKSRRAGKGAKTLLHDGWECNDTIPRKAESCFVFVLLVKLAVHLPILWSSHSTPRYLSKRSESICLQEDLHKIFIVALNNLKNIVLNKRRYTQNHTYCLISFVGSSRKDRTSIQKGIRGVVACGAWGRLKEGRWWKCWLYGCTYLKTHQVVHLRTALHYNFASGKSGRSILSNSCNYSLAQIIKDCPQMHLESDNLIRNQERF